MEHGERAQIELVAVPTVDVAYTVIQGLETLAGVGNFDAPAQSLFVDGLGRDGSPGTADDDLRLVSGSPAIDCGLNAAVPEGLVLDIGGLPRRIDDPRADDCWQEGAACGAPPIVAGAGKGASTIAAGDHPAGVSGQVVSPMIHWPSVTYSMRGQLGSDGRIAMPVMFPKFTPGATSGCGNRYGPAGPGPSGKQRPVIVHSCDESYSGWNWCIAIVGPSDTYSTFRVWSSA